MHQGETENITDFLSCLWGKADKCDYHPAELNEHLIEMIILSTPLTDFKKELLPKPKGLTMAEVLSRGREYEAIQASQSALQSLTMGASSNTANVDAVKTTSPYRQPCGNCGLHHKPRTCPAYPAVCRACGSKGHWRQMCHKTKGGTQPLPPDNNQPAAYTAKPHSTSKKLGRNG